MFRHVAMFRWNADATDADIAAISDGLNALAIRIPQIRAYHHGADIGLSDDTFDYVVVADFDDAADYVTYRDDTGHQELIASLIRPFIAERAAVQFELRPGN